MNKNQKGASATLVVVLLVVVFAVIGLVFLLRNGGGPADTGDSNPNVTQTSAAETETWTVYRNDAYKFQIKFPNDCVANDAYFGNKYAIAVGVTSPKWDDTSSAVVVIDHGNVGTLSLNNWIGQRYEPASGKAVTSKEATFNGYDALLVKDGNKTSYFMLKNMDVFEVYKTGKEKSLNGILGTFMFLD